MKKFFVILLLFFGLNVCVYAESSNGINDTYQEQFKMSGAEKLHDELPDEAAKSLDRIGVTGGGWEEFSNLTPEKVFGEIINVGKEKISSPF